jgi:hypothetical protein
MFSEKKRFSKKLDLLYFRIEGVSPTILSIPIGTGMELIRLISKCFRNDIIGYLANDNIL